MPWQVFLFLLKQGGSNYVSGLKTVNLRTPKKVVGHIAITGMGFEPMTKGLISPWS